MDRLVVAVRVAEVLERAVRLGCRRLHGEQLVDEVRVVGHRDAGDAEVLPRATCGHRGAARPREGAAVGYADAANEGCDA
jgi:hypothetical protein